MFPQRPMSGEATWRQVMEFESRKEVIKEWLSSPDIPSHLVETLQEMLATTEHQLDVLRGQGHDARSSFHHREPL
jgi:hypothetical protein